MSKNRTFFFVVFGLYHLAVFLFIYYVDNKKENLGLLMRVHDSIYLFKYGSLIGLGLFIVDFIWSWQTVWTSRKDHKALQAEINTIKAKMYDLKEKDKPQVDLDMDTNTDTDTE